MFAAVANGKQIQRYTEHLQNKQSNPKQIALQN